MQSTDFHLPFTHYSAEASKLVGIPRSPVIHLAILTVVDDLLPLAAQTRASASPNPNAARIGAFRVASRTVLEGFPIEWAKLYYLTYFGDEFDGSEAEVAYRTKRTDWLGEAKSVIESSGLDSGPDAKRMATRYGWAEHRDGSRAETGRPG